MSEAKWYVIFIGDTKRIPSISSVFVSSKVPHTLWIPTQNALRQFRGKEVVKPKVLFPGYVFVKFQYELAGIDDKIQTLGGYFLRGPGCPRLSVIPDEFIERIKKIELEKGIEELVENTFNLKVGEMVEVVTGPYLSGKSPIK